MTITIKQPETVALEMNEDGEFVCPHPDAYIERACCSGRDSEGNISCGCYGQDGVICPALNCTGIQDHETEGLFDRLDGGPDYD